jgi:hypothetical protein
MFSIRGFVQGDAELRPVRMIGSAIDVPTCFLNESFDQGQPQPRAVVAGCEKWFKNVRQIRFCNPVAL